MKPSIEFVNVTKKYRLGQALPSIRSVFGRKRTDFEKFHLAVNDVSFALNPGEALGVIGPNGAGKTTILKLLSKVTFPTSGEIRVNGRLSALIELGAGFHPELTGRENIYLNGTILGMKRAEIKTRFDDIVEFAGIGKFLDTPVKRYSSGMYARLGFAVAAHVDPEILLVDEVLAVGDMAFQMKCYERMKDLIRNGTTMLFVSHNMRAVQEVCQRCAVMYRGHKAFEGPTAEATAEFSNILRKAASNFNHHDVTDSGISQRVMTHTVVIEEVQLLTETGEPTLAFETGDVARVRATIRFDEDAESPILACRIAQPTGQVIYDYTTHWANLPIPTFKANSRAQVEFTMRLNLVAGTYQLGVNMAYQDLTRYYDRMDRALDFVVSGGNGARGVANLEAQLEILETETLQISPLGV